MMNKHNSSRSFRAIAFGALGAAAIITGFAAREKIGFTAAGSPVSRVASYDQPLPERKLLPTDYYIKQSFNNCGPAALSMALSHYGIQKTQEEIAADIRPYQNAKGVNDDKSTPPPELAQKAQEYGLIAYYRPNGSIEMLKKFLANDMAIIIRTRLNTKDDFAHYRVIKGYDQATGELIQDDSYYNGRNLRYTYANFLKIWKPFNYEYLVLVPPEKIDIARAIIGRDIDPTAAWQNAIRRAEQELAENPNDVPARLNLSVSLYYAGNYEQSVIEFEKIRTRLAPRILWYRIEPIQSHFELGNAKDVFAITDAILNNKNLAFSELYIMRGKLYLKDGKKALAKSEFEKAVLYNKNLKAAWAALNSVQ